MSPRKSRKHLNIESWSDDASAIGLKIAISDSASAMVTLLHMLEVNFFIYIVH